MEENQKMQEKLKHLKFYEKGLEEILDVRCSLFKSRHNRKVIEDHLVLQLSDEHSAISHIVKYPQLKDIYENDHNFCSWRKETNGKLRFLYIKQWKVQLDRERLQNIERRTLDYMREIVEIKPKEGS